MIKKKGKELNHKYEFSSDIYSMFFRENLDALKMDEEVKELRVV